MHLCGLEIGELIGGTVGPRLCPDTDLKWLQKADNLDQHRNPEGG